jgi:hypothetical protein
MARKGAKAPWKKKKKQTKSQKLIWDKSKHWGTNRKRLGMSGELLLRHLYAFMAWTVTFYLYILLEGLK